jgi:hypothetical protein
MKTKKALFAAAYAETNMAQEKVSKYWTGANFDHLTPEQTALVLEHLNKALCAWQEFHNRTCGHEPAKHG